MATDQTPAGSARVVKTKRLSHIVTADDLTAGFVPLDMVWDTPFVDDNYTVVVGIEVPGLISTEFTFSFATRTKEKVTALCDIVGTVGDAFVLHAIAIHD